jgi:hypothetical protein
MAFMFRVRAGSSPPARVVRSGRLSERAQIVNQRLQLGIGESSSDLAVSGRALG